MNHPDFKRFLRLVIVLLVIAIPLFAFLSVQTLPTAENLVQAAPLRQSGPDAPVTTEETQTAVAATQTSFAQTVQAAGTQTAVAATQTSIAGTQTAIARTQTAVAQPSSTAIYVDAYEPNNTIQSATSVQVNGAALLNLTLWPSGDVDFFRFVGKAGLAYDVFTSNLATGIDTVLEVYNTQGQFVASNDDFEFGNRASKVTFSVSVDGFYYARVTNKSPGDAANQTYRFAVEEVEGTATPTSFPTTTRVPGADNCEYNGDFDSSCLIGVGETYPMNFVPLFGEGPDNDFFRLWVKAGTFYTCETLGLSSVNDTNMILYDQNRNGIGGNDDKAPGDRGSLVSYYATYTGWLYVLVGPHAPPEYALSYLFTYSVECAQTVPTPTSTPSATPRPSTGGGGGVVVPTATPFVFPTFPPTPTQITFLTAEATPRPIVNIVPLPTDTPAAGGQQVINVNITVYYDANQNFAPEQTEGVEDVAVALYDNTTNELLAFGYTNEAGAIRFASLTVNGPIRVSIPFLSYSQVVIGDSNIFIRIAPWPVP